jgi:hypothetical protein
MSSTIQVQSTGTGKNVAQTRPLAGLFSQLRLRTLKGQFILQASLLLLLAAILTFAGATSLSRASTDLTTIDSGSIPSVNYAQAITQYIEVIDAQSADFLAAAGLTATAPCSIAGTSATLSLTVHNCDERNIDAETVLANEQLFQAAHNTTYPGEQTAVERITIGLESYLGDIRLMRTDFGLAQGKTDPTDPHLQQAYQAYLSASAILHDQISLDTLGTAQIPFDKETGLPACTLPGGQTLSANQWTQGGLTNALDCLSFINYSHLGSAYNDSANFLTSTTVLLAILCILFCGLLLFSIIRMIVTTRRLLNPGLVAATLLALFLSLTMVSLLGNLGAVGSQALQDGVFKQLVKDDYQSIYDAALLQRYGTDANADESRWLIAQEFNDQANVAHWQTDWNNNVQEIERLIQGAHANQTWQEEIQPLANIDTYWSQYHTIDGQIRSTAQNQSDPKRLLDAEAISTGISNQAFGHFINAVGQLSQANLDHYKQTLQSAQSSLNLDFLLCLILFPLAGLLALWGITIRLKDF